MKKIIILPFLIITLNLFSQAPFDQFPSFETAANGHVATGLGIADINGDGWKDIIVANGNDIHRQRLVVYYNQGDGTFPLNPDWQSSDIDYHGHLSAGDIDNDGDVDIAVSVYLGASGFGSPGRLKVYYNTGTELESFPSFESDPFYTFSCALGDADGDGDLDIAAACGEPYSSDYDKGRIFYNDNGSFYPVAGWESNIDMGALDVEFADVDQNGFLDLIFACEETNNYIFLADSQGNIDQDWDWQSDHPANFMNSLDFGWISYTSDPYFVSTGNDQLGGDGKIKQFSFSLPIPEQSPPSWESDYVGYGSGILLADINQDENLDLLYGGWWEPLSILEGNGSDWNPIPIYHASTSSVVEAILMSDLGKFNYVPASQGITPSQDRAIFYLEHQIIEQINSVFVNGVQLDRTEYCYVELKNWISLKNHISNTDAVVINYKYMRDGDIVISNWDSSKGNFIYYNTNNPVGISDENLENYGFEITTVSPQPATDELNISINNFEGSNIELQIYDMCGRIAGSWKISAKEQISINISHLPAGVYAMLLSDGRQFYQKKIVVTN